MAADQHFTHVQRYHPRAPLIPVAATVAQIGQMLRSLTRIFYSMFFDTFIRWNSACQVEVHVDRVRLGKRGRNETLALHVPGVVHILACGTKRAVC